MNKVLEYRIKEIIKHSFISHKIKSYDFRFTKYDLSPMMDITIKYKLDGKKYSIRIALNLSNSIDSNVSELGYMLNKYLDNILYFDPHKYDYLLEEE